ncbi:hypothetical protein Patl1_37326 [Pistacia atlantica]|nr:hypothetical protein Patl1_37326 [Pistacia atlantica]
MATLFIFSHAPLSHLSCSLKNTTKKHSFSRQRVLSFTKHPFGQKSGRKLVKYALKEEQESEQTSTSSSPVAVADEKPSGDTNGSEMEASKESEELEQQQEMDWKTDEDFKKFMGNPSIEAAIKLEKKRADRKLKELDRENGGNPLVGLFNRFVRENLSKEKERLEKAEETFKALDLNKLKSCFGFDTFFATDVRRFGDGGIFIGNLRKPIEEVIPKLEKKLSEAAGREIVVWFMEEKTNDITKQACVVQPKAEMDLQFESTKLSTPWANVVPLFGGFISILGVSEIATRVTAVHYGVKLSPSFLVPIQLDRCIFDITGYLQLLLLCLMVASMVVIMHCKFSMAAFKYIRPQFFYNNPLLSFIQYVIGPYTDDLGNVLPYAVEGVGVPCDPLAFAGLLGMVVTSLNLLPCGRLEGGRIAQAMFGRSTATLLSFATSLLLGIGGLSGSVLCLAWGLFATFFRGGEEIPTKDEITPLGDNRYAWGFVLGLICFLTLFPNGGGTFNSSFLSDPFFRGDL